MLLALLTFAHADEKTTGHVRVSKKTNEIIGRVVVVVKDDTADNVAADTEITIGSYDCASPIECDPTESVTVGVGDLRKVTNRYKVTGLTFDDDPVGWTFDTTVTLQDADGYTVGQVDSLTVSPVASSAADEELGAGADGGWFASATAEMVDGSDVEVLVGIKERTAGDFKVVTKLKGDEDLPNAGIASIEVQFNEPFEGPSPQENPLTLTQVSEKEKFSNKKHGLSEDFTDVCDAGGALFATFDNDFGFVVTASCDLDPKSSYDYGDIILMGEPIDIE